MKKLSIGERIRRIRILKGFTQKSLSEKASISERLLRNFEAGTRNPKDDNLQKIADALDVNIWALKDVELDTHDTESVRQFFLQMEEKGLFSSGDIQLSYQPEPGDGQYFLKIPIGAETAAFLSQWKMARSGALKHANGEVIGYEEWKYDKTLQKK